MKECVIKGSMVVMQVRSGQLCKILETKKFAYDFVKNSHF